MCIRDRPDLASLAAMALIAAGGFAAISLVIWIGRHRVERAPLGRRIE